MEGSFLVNPFHFKVKRRNQSNVSFRALYTERKKYLEGEKPSGQKIEVTFADGEVVVGSTLGYDTKRSGFFLFPADPRSNNIRVFAASSAVLKVRHL